MSGSNPYNTALDKNAANYTPLSPLSLIARTAYVYPQRVAVIHGATRLTWSEVYARCRRWVRRCVAMASVPATRSLRCCRTFPR